MSLSHKFLSVFVLIVCQLNSSQEYSVHRKRCDFKRYENGCEDTIGFDCVNNTCVCKEDFALDSTGICLKTSPIGLKCESSEQCFVFDVNSMCFASDNQFKEWHCLCKPDFYYNNLTKKCLEKISFGKNCNQSEQCLAQNSVCNDNNRCVCHQNHYFDDVLNECKHNNSLKCSEGHEWNQFINKCQPVLHYSHKGGRGGGGRGGGGRSGSRGGGWGGSRGGGASIRGGGRSWWTTSWFARRGTGYSSDGGGGGSYYDDDDDLAWDKFVVVLIALLIIVFACCYCSYKFRQQDKEAEQYWRNRTQRVVPRIVIKGTDEVDATNMTTNYENQIRRSSEVGGRPIGHPSRSPSPTTFDHLFQSGVSEPLPSSPPPPYTPTQTLPHQTNSSQILPFASGSSHSRRKSASNSPLLPRYESHNRSNSFSTQNRKPLTDGSTEPLIRHPSNSNLILPFASAPPSDNINSNIQ